MLLGCVIFDIAIIMAYFAVFGLFFLIAPAKSMIILFVILLSLFVLNGVLVLPSKLFKSLGISYTNSIVTVLLLYVIVSNVFTIILIPEGIISYIVWELIVLAAFFIIISVIARFSKMIVNDSAKNEKEKSEYTSMRIQLLEIEKILIAKVDQVHYLDIFKSMKERIDASTPFGRISDNNEILQIENQIKSNLSALKSSLEGRSTDINLIEMQELIENTQRLVMNREILNRGVN